MIVPTNKKYNTQGDYCAYSMLILTPYLGIEMAAKFLNGKAIVALQGLYRQKSTTP